MKPNDASTASGWSPHCMALLAAALLLPFSAAAQQAVVTTQDSAALEIGQALLAHYGGQCFAIMPTHVFREAKHPALLREGAPALLGESIAATDLGDDVGIVGVAGGISAECGSGALTIRRSIERLLQQGRLGTLRSVNGDGTVAQLAVAIVDDDGRGLLRVQPTHQDNPIRKGLSGSLLMIDGVATGMLLSVNARSGVGTVVRIDALMSKVDAHLMGMSDSQPHPPKVEPTTSTSTRHASTPAPGLRVLAWSALPIDEARRTANLTAEDDAPAWASQPTNWPVTIDLQAGEQLVTLSGLLLDGRNVADPGQLPAWVEIFINPSGEPGAWRLITSTAVTYLDGVGQIDLAPLRTRLLRLSFGATVNGGRVISLGRVVLRRD